jgi:hypothetical protein
VFFVLGWVCFVSLDLFVNDFKLFLWQEVVRYRAVALLGSNIFWVRMLYVGIVCDIAGGLSGTTNKNSFNATSKPSASSQHADTRAISKALWLPQSLGLPSELLDHRLPQH